VALINSRAKEVQVKLVYYGPDRCGKTTNLEYIYSKYQNRMATKLTTVKTDGDRTLFFDFLPLDIGKIGGYHIKIQLYTVPGQVRYGATRRLVLRGVDGVVFVADSMALREKMNIAALKDLQENLSTFDKNIFNIPLVIQYNKRDLSKEGIPILSIEKLEDSLNRQLKAPSFAASARAGENVVATMRKAIFLTVSSLKEKLSIKQGDHHG